MSDEGWTNSQTPLLQVAPKSLMVLRGDIVARVVYLRQGEEERELPYPDEEDRSPPASGSGRPCRDAELNACLKIGA